MMQCKFLLTEGGRTLEFSSEMALNDHLRDTYRYAPILGDMAFSTNITASQKYTLAAVKSLNAESKQLQALKPKTINSNDSKDLIYNNPFIGVNDFLQQYTFVDASNVEHHLFPIFKADNYWETRYKAWKDSDPSKRFTEEEIDTFFSGDKTEAANNTINDKTTAETYRKMMEERWANQCFIGDAIHQIMQSFFQYNSKISGYEGDRLSIMSDTAKIQYFRSKFQKSGSYQKGDYKVNRNDVLTDAQILDACLYASKLMQNLRDQYGEGAVFVPELAVSGKLTQPLKDGNIEKAVGNIDLLVIDQDSNIHILDYKVSPKSYSDTSTAKERTYMYQLATYARILEHNGIRLGTATSTEIVPIQLGNFHKQQDGTFTYDKISVTNNQQRYSLTGEQMADVKSKIKNVFDVPDLKDTDFKAVDQAVYDTFNHWVPGYNKTSKITREELVEMIREDDGFVPDANGFLSYIPKGLERAANLISPVEISKFSSSAEAEKHLVDQLYNLINRSAEYRQTTVSQLTNALKAAIAARNINGDNVVWPSNIEKDNSLSVDWLKYQMAKYCTGNWKIIEGQQMTNLFNDYGMIALENIHTHQVDFIKVSAKPIKVQYSFAKRAKAATSGMGETLKGKRTYISGAFKTDTYYQAKEQELLHSEYGNLELMEMMLILNQIPGFFTGDRIVGQLSVVQPKFGQLVTASNRQIMASFNELDSVSSKKLEHNWFKENKIKMASEALIAKTDYLSLMAAANAEGSFNSYKKYKDLGGIKAMENMDWGMDNEQKLSALEALKEKMEKGNAHLNKEFKNLNTHDLAAISELQIQLYRQVLIAIAECKGVHFQQQLKDHSKILESLNVLRNGVSGSMIDNPGNLQSDTLNLLTKLTLEAYQNTRNAMQPKITEIRNLAKEYKKAKGFSLLKTYTVGIEASVYQNLYQRDTPQSKDNFLFKFLNDSSLDSADRTFLKKALRIINRRRMPLKSEAELDAMEANNEIEYYQVPLKRGTTKSVIAQKGYLGGFKEFLKDYNPKDIVQRVRDKAVGLFTIKDSLDHEQVVGHMFQLDNDFDLGQKNKESRRRYIARKSKEGAGGTTYFETNVETLLLAHEFAYEKTDHVNNIMPTIKAALAHLINQGAHQNTSFNNDIDYLVKYVQDKIKGEVIHEEKFEKVGAYLSMIRQAGSYMALAFSPITGMYQGIQSLWTTASLIIRKPDGTSAFSFKNFAKAFQIVYKDLFLYGDKPSVCSKLNEVYGINDMDMNTYIERVQTDRHGFWNFDTLAFKFASRPDYYNRMSIIVAKMLEEGSFEAHSLDKDGNLVYDWKKDKRFNLLSGPQTNSPEYINQRSLFHAIARQFQDEGVKDASGNAYKVNMAKMELPQAYTNKEMESIKSIADEIYGYYTHEKKSLIQSTWWGAMFMQMRTYWSAKKNQYFAHGGVKMQGHWEQLKMPDGQPAYYPLDANGNVDYRGVPTATNTGYPITQWKGDWKEGIFSTMAQLSTFKGDLTFRELWNHEDPTLRLCYRSNLQKLCYDLTMFLTGGAINAFLLSRWIKDVEDDTDKSKISDACKLTAANILKRSVENSFTDFDLVGSVFKPLVSLEPFAFDNMVRTIQGAWKVATGDKDADSFIIGSTSVGKQLRPIWHAISVQD